MDQELDISKLKEYDRGEVGKLARLVTVWTYNTVLGYVQTKEETEEVIQDTLMAALNGISNFKKESNIKTWVYRIAINKSKDAVKYKNRKKRFARIISISKNADSDDRDFDPINMTHPGVELESKEQIELLMRGIDQLPEKQKEALILAKFEQMSMKEIAVIMNTTDKAIESLLSRAKSNFKTYLENEGIKHIK